MNMPLFPMPYVLVDSDDGKSFRTGRIIGKVHCDNFLVQFDTMNGSELPLLPVTMIHVNEMSAMSDDGIKLWSFFETEQLRKEWIDWLNEPNAPKVVHLVKK